MEKTPDKKMADVATIGHFYAKMKKNKGQYTRKRKISTFERRYSKLDSTNQLKPERPRIDYVLVYENASSEAETDGKKRAELKRHERNREKFHRCMKKEGFSIQTDIINDHVYVKLHCPFKRLCVEAERVKIEMPLKNCEIPDKPGNCWDRLAEKHLVTDDEVTDYVSTQFVMNKIDLFKDYDDPTNFFRPSVRSLLVMHILINMNIDDEKMEGEEDDDDGQRTTCACLPQICRNIFCCCNNKQLPQIHPAEKDNSEGNVLKRKGLRYLLMRGSYTDTFILHDESESAEKREKVSIRRTKDTSGNPDPRKRLDDTWTKWFKYQPMWYIRDYFGEKIAFYFAWTGMLITTLWIPLVFGIIVFFYGLHESVTEETTVSNSTTPSSALKDVLGDVKKAFDNNITPFYALFICAWGTLFLEVWKRHRITLAYEWDVDQFESNEPDRPQFYGTRTKTDPVSEIAIWFYPMKRRLLKFGVSFSILILMVALVLVSVVAIILYRIIMSIDYCPQLADNECFMLTTLLSSVLNGLSILLLGKLYDKLAVMLTDWENHRTQTKYDDALIIKLFAFQFVNSYASCFYIAFFRGRGSIFNDRYVDSCEGSCMTQLSFQVLVLMVIKPVPKFAKDILIPFAKKIWMQIVRHCSCCRRFPCCKVKEQEVDIEDGKHQDHMAYLEHERLKPDLGDFTLGEYTEKVILYGFLMLFASSFPLAPLVASLICYVDMKIDAKRMLWWYRRPVATVAQDIGMWYDILQLVNFIGVITNACIIAFTSNWGTQFDLTGKLLVVLGFEHIVFALKFILAYIIPDVPQQVNMAIRREKYKVMGIMEKVQPHEIGMYTELFPTGTNGKLKEDVEDLEGSDKNTISSGG